MYSSKRFELFSSKVQGKHKMFDFFVFISEIGNKNQYRMRDNPKY